MSVWIESLSPSYHRDKDALYDQTVTLSWATTASSQLHRGLREQKFICPYRPPEATLQYGSAENLSVVSGWSAVQRWQRHPVFPRLMSPLNCGAAPPRHKAASSRSATDCDLWCWTHQQEGKPVQVIRAGDVISCPADVKHWRRAAPGSAMTHLATTGMVDGKSWKELVTDEQYHAH